MGRGGRGARSVIVGMAAWSLALPAAWPALALEAESRLSADRVTVGSGFTNLVRVSVDAGPAARLEHRRPAADGGLELLDVGYAERVLFAPDGQPRRQFLLEYRWIARQAGTFAVEPAGLFLVADGVSNAVTVRRMAVTVDPAPAAPGWLVPLFAALAALAGTWFAVVHARRRAVAPGPGGAGTS